VVAALEREGRVVSTLLLAEELARERLLSSMRSVRSVWRRAVEEVVVFGLTEV
jgi:hypothetical protein